MTHEQITDKIVELLKDQESWAYNEDGCLVNKRNPLLMLSYGYVHPDNTNDCFYDLKIEKAERSVREVIYKNSQTEYEQRVVDKVAKLLDIL